MPLPRRPSREEVEEHNARQRTEFDRTVHLFDVEIPPEITDRLKRIVESAAIRQGDVVVDVGSGIGVLIPLISAYRPGRIVVCDLSEGMLERLKERHRDIEVHCSDIADLRLPEESVDVVFMNAVFANIIDKEGALTNSRRMLKRGGRLVISHPMGREWFERFLLEWGDRYFDGRADPAKFADLLSETGFTMNRYQDSDLYLVVAKARA